MWNNKRGKRRKLSKSIENSARERKIIKRKKKRIKKNNFLRFKRLFIVCGGRDSLNKKLL